MSDDLREALDSVRAAMVTLPRDASLDHRDAWVYAILVGWGVDDEGAEILQQVAAQHRWEEADVARLRRYARAVQAAREASAP